MRRSFQEDPDLRGPLFELLDVVFPGVRAGADELDRLGASWASISTPYVHVEEGRVIGHVGLIELPLIVLGRATTVGSIHAVATHPEHRRRGHYRRLMDALLSDAEGRLETLVLSTENPEYYEPFGFRVLEEHAFRVAGPTRGAADDLRRLDLAAPDDVARLDRLLAGRAPVSRVVGGTGQGSARAAFLFSESRRPILYSRELDVALCLEVLDGELQLYDVVGPRVPSIEALRAVLPAAEGDLVLHFAPDRMATDARPISRVFEHGGPSYLLARGRFDAEGTPFTLPRPLRT